MSESTLKEFVGKCTLTSVSQFELSAKRADSSGAATESETVDPMYGLNIDLRDADDGFRVRLSTRIESARGVIVSEVGAEYVVTSVGIRSVPRSMLIDFVNNVALMHILPYTRQSISDITSRVFESPLLMPMIQRGELSFSEDTD